MKALVVGWFSWEHSDSTAGDFLAADVLCEWLTNAGISFDIALAPPFSGGVDMKQVQPGDYPLVLFVCGPFMKNAWEAEFLGRFADSFVCGVNVSLPVPLDEWNPFDLLLERDSSRRAHPDLAFSTRQQLVPVVGTCLVEPYDEARVPIANQAIERLVSSREMSVMPIDTRLDINATGLRTKAEVESALARMEAVITTRLHGTVLSLKNGVPALVIDPEPGGGRIRRQAQTIGWPVVFTVDALDDHALRDALDYCLTKDARAVALQCAERARAAIAAMRASFQDAIQHIQVPGAKREARRSYAASRARTPGKSP
jgi:hypothetical protein